MDTKRFLGIVKGILCITAVVSVLFVMIELLQHNDTKTKLSTGKYTYYYNGQEVDGETIDIDLYRYTVDDSKLVVYLTDKPSTRVLPMVIPVGK